MRRLDMRVTITFQVAVAEIVAEDHNDVRSLLGRRDGHDGKCQYKCTCSIADHDRLLVLLVRLEAAFTFVQNFLGAASADARDTEVSDFQQPVHVPHASGRFYLHTIGCVLDH